MHALALVELQCVFHDLKHHQFLVILWLSQFKIAAHKRLEYLHLQQLQNTRIYNIYIGESVLIVAGKYWDPYSTVGRENFAEENSQIRTERSFSRF